VLPLFYMGVTPQRHPASEPMKAFAAMGAQKKTAEAVFGLNPCAYKTS
jgi:hypothetical protein